MKKKILILIAAFLLPVMAYGGFWLYDYFSVGSPLGVTLTPAQPNIPDDQPINVVVFGDSGDGSSGQSELAALMVQEDFDLVFHLGDIVYPRGSYDDFQTKLLDVYDQTILDAMWPVMGNHDFSSVQGGPYLDVFELPTNAPVNDLERYYSVNIGRLHLIGLDTNQSLDQVSDENLNDMADWLRDDLNGVAEGSIVIISMHHNAFSVGKHDPDPLVRQHLVPIFDEFNVPLVLSGHDHNYQRTCPLVWTATGEQCNEAGTHYIVSGGGSDNSYPIDDDVPGYFEKTIATPHYLRLTIQPNNEAIDIQAIDKNQQMIDEVTF